jgi:FMN phosphatase YigB (HAD superfamily)
MSVMPGRLVRCILFDLGSTLWHHADPATWTALETEANLRAAATLRTLLPAEALPTMADEALGAALRRMIGDEIRHRYQVTGDREPDFGDATAHALHTLGIAAADTPLGARVFEALRVRAVTSRVLFPDALPTLAELHARGYLLGIVTNRDYGGEPFLADLRQMGLLDHIEPEHVAISGDVGYRKPHPAIFWHALNRLQVPLAEAAMVGDRLTADVYGAQQLGLFTVWRPWPREWAAAHDQEFTSSGSDPRQPGELESGAGAADAADAADDASLFAWARVREQTQSPQVRTMRPPDAVIRQIGDVLRLFRDPTQPLISARLHS